MNHLKKVSSLIAAGLLMASVVGVAPVSAQGVGNGNGNHGGGCNSTAGANTGGANTGGTQTHGNSANTPSNSTGVLVGLVDVLVQDVNALNGTSALNNLNAQISDLANSNSLSVVCLNDVLNQNDVHILQDILNNSPILSGDLNNSLNNNSVLNDLLSHSNVANGVQVVGVNLATGNVYVL